MAGSASPILLAAVEILVDGKPLDVAAAGQIVEVQVDDDLGLPGAFSFDLVMTTADTGGRAAWLDGDAGLALGHGVEIRMGYEGRMASVIVGEITALEPRLASAAAPLITVRGYDPRHRLQRGSHTRTFKASNDRELVEKLGRAAGLKVSRSNSSGLDHDYLLQANQTDLDFLQARADAIDYELLWIDGELVFRPTGFGDGAVTSLEMGADLAELNLVLSIAALPSALELRSSGIAGKDAVRGQSAAGSEKSRMGGATSASSLSSKVFGDARMLIVSQPVVDKTEADAQARASFHQFGLQLLEAEGLCIGRTDLRVGTVVEIKAAGKRYSGLYYLVSVGYHYDLDSGVETRFRARRDAL